MNTTHSFQPRSRLQGAVGFTLMELMVVITIIAVLLAMIMPVIGMARESALRLRCSSNLHQVGLAYGCYLNDYDGFLPDQQDGANFCYVDRNLMDPYLKRTDRTDQGWICPAMYREILKKRTPVITNGDSVFYYNWNIVIRDMKPFGTSNIGSASLRMPVTIQRIVYAPEAMIFCDLDAGSSGGYHNSRANMLMADLSLMSIRDESRTDITAKNWATDPRSVTGNWVHSNPAWVVRGFSVRP